MDDYSELIVSLRNCAVGAPCVDCKQKPAFDCDWKMMDEAADAIEELLKLNAEITRRELRLRMKMPKWISARERLPEVGEPVLCACRANIYEVLKMRTDGSWVHIDAVFDSGYMNGFVTHWQTLPEPPKEVKT